MKAREVVTNEQGWGDEDDKHAVPAVKPRRTTENLYARRRGALLEKENGLAWAYLIVSRPKVSHSRLNRAKCSSSQ